MRTPSDGHKQLVNEFLQLLEKTGNDSRDMKPALEFFTKLSRYKDGVPPTAELITVFKRHRPILHQFLKKAIARTSPVHFLLQLDMNYEAAVERLGLTDEQLAGKQTT